MDPLFFFLSFKTNGPVKGDYFQQKLCACRYAQVPMATSEKLLVVVILGSFQLSILSSFCVRSLKEVYCHKLEVFYFHSLC